MRYWATGDFHGDATDFRSRAAKIPEGDAIIVLGDAGLNYCKDYNDEYAKKVVNELGHLVYIVRGNHEIRPSNLRTMKYSFDINIQGNVFYEEDYPNIRYLDDYAIYSFNGYTVGVIGGAYSVDKYYRIGNGYKWFIDEQLTDDEQRAAMSVMANQNIDIMLTHTCPIEWQPRDLFLPMLDQESVDTSMEEFLTDVRRYSKEAIQ